MSVQIADATNFITITIDGVVRGTLPKRKVALEIDGSNLVMRYEDVYVSEVAFADVTSPVAANIEALRTAVKNFLIA